MQTVAIAGISAFCVTYVGLLVALLVVLASTPVPWDGQCQHTPVQIENDYTCRRYSGIKATQCTTEQCSPCQIIPTASMHATTRSQDARRDARIVRPDSVSSKSKHDTTQEQNYAVASREIDPTTYTCSCNKTLSPDSHCTDIICDMNYNNAVLTITNISTPDPHVTFAGGVYHLVYTAGDRVEIWSSPNLLKLGETCQKTVVWRPPPGTDYSADIWAPELHAINGRWYIYVAAANPRHGNKSHRMYVLGGPPSNTNPATNGGYQMLGPIAGLPNTQWQIDGTVFPLNRRLYFAYSGWPLNQTDASELTQELFITELSNATTAAAAPVQISAPHEPWERSGDHGINEGPQFLSSPNNSWLGLAYSCAGSWTKDYKMNTLKYNGGDPLQPSSWIKSRHPLIQNSGRNGPFGPGHGSFVNVEGETWAIYHATDREDQGWDGRKARVQRVVWGHGGPEMGGCVGTLVRDTGGFMGGVGMGVGSESQEGRHSIRGIFHEAKERFRNL